MSVLVHIVYVHGFHGNDTTFQIFPRHLQEYLDARIPQNLNIRFQTSIYPTYKSVKPLSHATRNFLQWLGTQPPGPVIIMSHSMGGLLAAEAATDISNNPNLFPGAPPRRIVGIIAFDTPFLGMHPHVVVSGLASLMPKKDEAKMEAKLEHDLNENPNVHIVDHRVTDGWEEFKRTHHVPPPAYILASSASSMYSHYTKSTGGLSPGSSIHSRTPSPTPLLDRAFAFIGTDDSHPVVRWIHKHADEPFTAGKRWIVERFQFGSCMFDPTGLKSRYSHLAKWDGLWVNYWTQTPSDPTNEPGEESKEAEMAECLDNDDALVVNGVVSPTDGPTSPHSSPSGSAPPSPGSSNSSTRSSSFSSPPRKLKKGRRSEPSKKKGHHFVVLPNGIGRNLGGWDKWENVVIRGVKDEVAAHTGLFIPEQNLDYDGLVERVGTKVLSWCQIIPGLPPR